MTEDAEDARRTRGDTRGAAPDPEDLLGKVLDNPQNLLKGRREGLSLRMGDCGKVKRLCG